MTTSVHSAYTRVQSPEAPHASPATAPSKPRPKPPTHQPGPKPRPKPKPTKKILTGVFLVKDLPGVLDIADGHARKTKR